MLFPSLFRVPTLTLSLPSFIFVLAASRKLPPRLIHSDFSMEQPSIGAGTEEDVLSERHLTYRFRAASQLRWHAYGPGAVAEAQVRQRQRGSSPPPLPFN